MTDKQPEALRLASALVPYYDYGVEAEEAAFELRRLHEANQAMLEALREMLDLVEGSDRYMGLLDACDGYYGFSARSAPTREKARAAIARATGVTKE